jgi:hypothetical protein
MAKKKLSPSKREALRKEIGEQFAAGVPRIKIVNGLSKKYGIAPITMRWYLRTGFQSHSGSRLPSLNPASSTPDRSAVTRGQLHQPSPPLAADLPKILFDRSEAQLKRLLEAKKLIPRLQAARDRERKLQEQIRRLDRERRAEASRAVTIERQVRALSK